MSYTEQHFKSGDTLFAAQLNEMDSALADTANTQSRAEQYYAYLTGSAASYPATPQSRVEEYLHFLCENGGTPNPETMQEFLRKLDEKSTKVRIDYYGNKIFKMGNAVLNFEDLYNYHMVSPDFTFVVYNNRAYLCSYVNVPETGMKEMRFESVINSDNRTKVSSIYVVSNDGVAIENTTVSDINSENSSNKVDGITEANQNSGAHYPSTKAVHRYVDPLNKAIPNLLGNEMLAFVDGYYIRLDGSIADVNNPVVSQSTASYCVTECEKGDVFHITGRGGAGGRLWGFVKSDGTVLEKAAENAEEELGKHVAPEDSAWFVVNTFTPGIIYKGTFLREDISQIGEDVSKMLSTRIIGYTVSNLFGSSSTNTFNYNEDSKSVVFRCKGNTKYKVTVKGTHNRFAMFGTDREVKQGNAVTGRYVSMGTDTRTETEYEFTTNPQDTSICLNLGYGIDISNLGIEIVEGYIGENYACVGDFIVPTKGRTDKIESALDKFTMTNTDIVPEVFAGYSSGGTIYADNKSALYWFVPFRGTIHKVTINGDFNRFLVMGSNEAPRVGAQYGDVLYRSGISAETSGPAHALFDTGDYPYVYVMVTYSAELVNEVTVIGNYSANAPDVIAPMAEEGRYDCYICRADTHDITTHLGVYAAYDELVARYPDYVSMTILGNDGAVNSKEIREYTFGTNYNNYIVRPSNPNDEKDSEKPYVGRSIDDKVDKPTILLMSGVHGDERSAVLSLLAFFQDLCRGSGRLGSLRGRFKYRVIPIATPSGYDANSRVNWRGVNVNRNFAANYVQTSQYLDEGETQPNHDYSGSSAASENETSIAQNWIRANAQAKALIDCHNSNYVNELAVLIGDNGYTGMDSFKSAFLRGLDRAIPKWKGLDGFPRSIVYGYTADSSVGGSARLYAGTQGVALLAATLEMSWNQNNTGLHSATTIKTGAEAVAAFLEQLLNESAN